MRSMTDVAAKWELGGGGVLVCVLVWSMHGELVLH